MDKTDRYTVKADHPVFKRIDKYNLTFDEMTKLVIELRSFNYDNIKIEKNEKKC